MVIKRIVVLKKFKRKIWYKIHSWIGITAGLMLFLVCWSGTVAVFSYELDWLLNPGLHGNITTEKIDWQRAYGVFKKEFPKSEIFELSAPRKEGYAMDGWGSHPDESRFNFYIDPATYELTKETTYFNVQRFFRSFHMSLFETEYFNIFGVPFGYFIVGVLGFVLMASAITGFLFYKKWRIGFFKLTFKKGLRRLWSDAHKLIGLWSLWFALLIGGTGAWYLMEWWLPEPPYIDTATLPIVDSDIFLPINQLADTANRDYPELEIERLSFIDFNRGRLTFEGDDGSFLVRKRAAYITLDALSGNMVVEQKPSNLSFYVRWWETVDLLHFGKFAGLWSKWLYFIFGLALSGLCLTGAYLQAKRQRLKSGIKSYRISMIIAYGLTILILVMSSLAGWQEIKGYGSEGNWPEMPFFVFIFLVLWVLSTIATLTIWMKSVR